MGAITPTINALTTTLSQANPALHGLGFLPVITEQSSEKEHLRRDQNLALKQLREKQDAQLSTLQTQTQLERDRLEADTQASEEKRLAALRRAVARQRSQFAAQGLGGTGTGSTDAVLLGLFEESDTDRTERDRIDQLRNRALDQDLSSQKQLNILQRSQLQERQRLERELLGF